MDPQLKKQCRQTIYVARLVSVSVSGDPTYGTPAAMKCRCEDDEESSDSANGEELVTRMRIVTEAVIYKTDRVWLPGVDSTQASLARVPMKVQEVPDERGRTDHFETVV